jgi:hypothetical protein
MKILILGAGLAGSVAAGALSSFKPIMIEARPGRDTPVDGHYAVMRMRSPDIGKYLGCELEKVHAEKWVLWEGKLYDKCTPQMNNLYSYKAYDGEIGYRSIMDLGEKERYLLPVRSFSSYHDIRYGEKVVGIGNQDFKRFLTTEAGAGKGNIYEYDILISTIPMPSILEVTGLTYHSDKFEAFPIYTATFLLKKPTNVYQTIYVPQSDHITTRVTLSGKVVIFESSEDGYCGEEDSIDAECIELLKYFGLSRGHVDSWKFGSQPSGKMVPIDDSVRRLTIMALTEEYNIYSFGRYALWKPIRADNLVDDIEKIKRMITLSQERRRYEGRLA